MARNKSIADVSDDVALQALGHKGELERSFSPLAMLGLAFACLNSWTALSTSLGLALPSGGPTSVIWGLVVAGIFSLSIAASLAEFLSAYPTAAGQIHWAAVAAPRRYSAVISYFTGWIGVGAWLSLTATAGLLASTLILGIISLFHDEFEPKSWMQFVIYIVYNVGAFLINAFAGRLLPMIDRSAIIWSLGGFTIICITLLATASPNFNSGDFVFREFINHTGWPDGIAWLLGLLQGGFGLTAFDGVAHMIEEIPNPTIEGPKIMIACVGMGLFTGFVFLTVLLFVAGDIENVISSSASPLLQIFYDATSNRAGAVCLLMFPLVCIAFANVAIMTTSSRITWAFARDHGMLFSRFFGKINRKLDAPVNALMLTLGVDIIFGCVFLGSSAAFNAITSASVIAYGISYAIPIALNMMAMRRKLPEVRAFKLPDALGWTLNVMSIVYVLITTVLFFFPPAIPVTGTNMNYAIVAFAVWMIVAVIAWFTEGRKHYTGPSTEIDEQVLTATQSPPSAFQPAIIPGMAGKGDGNGSDSERERVVPAGTLSSSDGTEQKEEKAAHVEVGAGTGVRQEVTQQGVEDANPSGTKLFA